MIQQVYRVKGNGHVEVVDIQTVMPDFKGVSKRFAITPEMRKLDPVGYIINNTKPAPAEIIECVSSNPQGELRSFVAFRP